MGFAVLSKKRKTSLNVGVILSRLIRQAYLEIMDLIRITRILFDDSVRFDNYFLRNGEQYLIILCIISTLFARSMYTP